MFEDNIDFDDLDLESESDYEGSDNDNEEDVLEVDDQEGKELLKNFLEINGDVPGLRRMSLLPAILSKAWKQMRLQTMSVTLCWTMLRR